MGWCELWWCISSHVRCFFRSHFFRGPCPLLSRSKNWCVHDICQKWNLKGSFRKGEKFCVSIFHIATMALWFSYQGDLNVNRTQVSIWLHLCWLLPRVCRKIVKWRKCPCMWLKDLELIKMRSTCERNTFGIINESGVASYDRGFDLNPTWMEIWNQFDTP